jgi:Type III restriction enzyme, res subunit
MQLTFPSVLGIDVEEAENPIREIGELKSQREGNVAPFTSGRTTGFLFRLGEADEVLILPTAKNVRDGYQRVLIGAPDPALSSNDLSKGEWRKHPLIPVDGAEPDYAQRITEVINSWDGAFSFVEEDPGRNVVGLRRPQIGGVHSAHMHWIVSNSPATIVMPTGTGKTETMLSILVSMRCQKLLVIVPTDALRTQLAEKFLTLGVLKMPGCAVLKEGARTPIVCALQHIPSTTDEVDRLFTRAQVIVTTSHIAGQCG